MLIVLGSALRSCKGYRAVAAKGNTRLVLAWVVHDRDLQLGRLERLACGHCAEIEPEHSALAGRRATAHDVHLGYVGVSVRASGLARPAAECAAGSNTGGRAAAADPLRRP